MGALRLFLALTVAGFHAGGLIGAPGFLPFGLYVACSAVVGFFVVSGYAMTALVDNDFMGRARIIPFYCERFVRLAPQYFAWLAISAILVLGLNIRSPL